MMLSSLGIFHTIVGITALVAAIISCLKYGKIIISNQPGKIYFYGTLITSLTALGISKHGGFNAGHAASLVIVIMLIAAWLLHYKMSNSKGARYVENFLLSFTFFFSWVPTINETFTRLPLGHPLASDSNAPVIAKTLLIFLILFIAGSVYQLIQQRKANRTE